MRAWAFAGVCVALVGCFGPEGSNSDSDAGGQDAAMGGGGSGGGGSGSGAGGSGGARDGGGPHLPDAQVLEASVRDSGGPERCILPADTGPCDGAFSRWAWNQMTGACELFSYGGCEGNANNFETPSECLRACAPMVDAGFVPGAACKVGDQVFPNGAGGIKDPHSCNTCSCSDGQLDTCTEIGCSQECPPNAAPSTSCAACGPVDNCEIVEHGCFVVCSDDSACAGMDFFGCVGGFCRTFCG